MLAFAVRHHWPCAGARLPCMTARLTGAVPRSDFINNDIRKNQHWALLPCYGALSTVRAGLPIRGNPPTFFSNEMWRRTGFTKVR